MSKNSKKIQRIESEIAAQKKIRNQAMLKCLLAVAVVLFVTIGKQVLVMLGYISSEDTVIDSALFVFTLGVCFFLVPSTNRFFAANRRIRELKAECQG